MSLLLILGALIATAPPAGPTGLDFYSPPPALAPATHGEVVWQRPLLSGSALPSAARNVLILYHTKAPDGADTVVSGTVAIPSGAPPKDGWPLVSWAHGTTGNAPRCAPSRDTGLNGEQRMLDGWVARGYAVAQTDYEGQGTPGVHPYFIESAAAHDVADMARAARQIDPDIGTRWIALGHSEGGTAALATAALGAAWAPELKLVGAISYAPGSHITSFLDGMLHDDSPVSELPLFALMVQSFGTYDPAVHMDKIFTPAFLTKLQDLRTRCLPGLMSDPAWNTQRPSQIFLGHPEIEPLAHDFVANEPSALHPSVPVLLLQGTSDAMVFAEVTRALDLELCYGGARVTFDLFAGKNHGTLLPASMDAALRWAHAAFEGAPAESNCGSPPKQF